MLASTKARNSSVAYNMRAVGGLMGGWRILGSFKKLRFDHKYKDVPEKHKEALYLQETVDEFALEEAQDTDRLHQLRQAPLEDKLKALEALPKFGVATFANAKATDPELPEKAIRGWAHVLEGRDGEEALREARKEFDGILERATCRPPLPPRRNAQLCLGVSLADEHLVIELDYRLSKSQKLQAYDDARNRGAKFAECNADNSNLGHHMLDAWFELLASAADEDARNVLRDAIRAHLTGNRSQPTTPLKVSRQLGFKGTPEQPLPLMTRTHAVEQTEWAFQEAAEAPPAPASLPSPVEQTPNAKPAPEAPPEQLRPVLTVDVAAASKPIGTAGKNLEAALDAAENSGDDSARIEYLKKLTMKQAMLEAGQKEEDKDEKKRKRPDSPPREKKAKTLTNVDHELNEEAGTTCPPPVAA